MSNPDTHRSLAPVDVTSETVKLVGGNGGPIIYETKSVLLFIYLNVYLRNMIPIYIFFIYFDPNLLSFL